MSVSIVFHLLAALAYGALGLWLWVRTARGHTAPTTSSSHRTLLTAAIVLHGAALVNGILAGHGLFLGWALALSAAIWLGMVIFWVQSLFSRINGLLLILLPSATLASLLAGLFPTGHAVAHANSEWLRIHLLIALAAYGLTAVAALHAILMAALDRQLHRPIEHAQQQPLLARVLSAMPPLLAQEQLLFQLLRVGFVVLTLTVISGAIVSLRLSSQLVPFDHKTVFTLLSWVTFGVLLWGRRTRGWRGRTALRWTLVGFAFVLLAYTGSRFVLDVIL